MTSARSDDVTSRITKLRGALVGSLVALSAIGCAVPGGSPPTTAPASVVSPVATQSATALGSDAPHATATVAPTNASTDATEGIPLVTGTPWPGTPSPECAASFLDTRLVEDAERGISGRSGDRTYRLVWPYGYTARAEGGRIAVVDYNGNVVAHSGDEVRIGGGFMGGDSFNACGTIDPLPVSTPR